VTSRATTIAMRLRADLEDLAELAKSAPAEADAIACSLVAHLRFSPPTEPNKDPRV
jgi:hypothetical protein